MVVIELSKKEDWEVIHGSQLATTVAVTTRQGPPTGKRRLALGLKRLLGPRLLERMASYEDYLLWDVIFKRYLADLRPGAKVLEVGSAPGAFLVRFKAAFDCVPYGLDYCDTGVALNRQL